MSAICVLVSIGRHPTSGLPRRADTDARALSLALAARDAGAATMVSVVHAGPMGEALLREYAGMGADQVIAYDLPEGFDPLPTLARHLAEAKPAIVLTGSVAEQGEASGFLPYALAAALGWPIAAPIAALDAGRGEVLEARPAGYRNRVALAAPFVAPVAAQAPDPRPCVFARTRAAVIDRREGVPAAMAQIELAPESPRPVSRSTEAPLAERLAALLQSSQKGQLLEADPDRAAAEIWAYLKRNGLVS